MANGYQFRLIKIDLLQGHDATLNAAPFYEICGNYTWNIIVKFTGLADGPPIIKINVSNDGVNWYQYNNCDLNQDGSNLMYYDSIMAFRYIQLEYDANGVTAGTVDAELLLKPN